MQGRFPAEAEILNKKRDRITYPLDNFRQAYSGTLPEIRALVTGAKTDQPALTQACLNCQWWGCGEPALQKRQDVTLLPDVGRSKQAVLNAAGVKSITDVPAFDFSSVKIRGVGAKTVDSLRRSATAFLSGKSSILSKVLKEGKAFAVSCHAIEDYLVGVFRAEGTQLRDLSSLLVLEADRPARAQPAEHSTSELTGDRTVRRKGRAYTPAPKPARELVGLKPAFLELG